MAIGEEFLDDGSKGDVVGERLGPAGVPLLELEKKRRRGRGREESEFENKDASRRGVRVGREKRKSNRRRTRMVVER